MRLGGRLSAAIEVLDDIQARYRPVADALKDWGLSHRFAGAGDRSAIGNLVYDALRRRRSASWLIDAETSRAAAFGAYLLESGQAADAVNADIADDRHAPAPLTDAERSAAARSIDAAPAPVRADIPDWCVPHFDRVFGEAWVAEGAALAMRPPLDLRINTLQATRERVTIELADLGIGPARLAPNGLRIAPIAAMGRHPNVQAEPAFRQGWVEVQDEGSQMVSVLADPAPGMQVLDYCAGAGGKTLAMAALMRNEGRIVAYDADKQRLAPIFDRLRRSGATNVDVVARSASLAELKGTMDLVLVDAPCTGSGTWRRRPDAKWRLTDRQLLQRQGEQARILADAQSFVKPGGLLCYVTCSVFDEENLDQIDGFLAANPDFHAVDHGERFRKAFPTHASSMESSPSQGIGLSPASSGTDGFFFSALRRDAA